jgi:LacI family transcriptional regulator
MTSESVRKRFQNGLHVATKLSDVAKLADVSISTVSRTLNAPEKVRPALAQRVRRAIEELHYVPDAAGRALASRRSRTIGAIIPTLSNPIFAAGIQAMECRLNECGYALIIGSSEYAAARQHRQVMTLIERGVDGLVLHGLSGSEQSLGLIEERGLPFVNIWSYKEDAAHPCIGFDNLEIAKRLAGYLLDLGHRHFAVIAGITHENDRATDRVEGVRAALLERGVNLEESRVVEKPYGIGEGRDGFRAVFRGPGPPPTAIIAGNDLLALGAIIEAHSSGMSVPGDLSVAGIDDVELAGHLEPGLTTMRVPSDKLGRLAADHIIDRLEGRPVEEKYRVEVELIVRGSTAPPPPPR